MRHAAEVSPAPLGVRIGAGVLLAVAVVACLVAGWPPLLPIVLVALGWLAVRPVPGLIYVLIVLMAPLGLWMIKAEAFMTWVFGGRDYALGLSATVIAVSLLARTLIRHPPTRRQLAVAAPVLAVLAVYAVIGVANHGLAQTVAGGRITTLPLILFVVLAALPHWEQKLLLNVAAILVIANGAAAAVEYVIGPAKLIAYGFREGEAVRVIGATFRAPGLTVVNAELGLLAGSFLLGYAALWLVRDLRPHREVLWHVAAGAAIVALALSTSRSAALLVAGGLGAAVVLNRGGGTAARRRARILGAALVVLLVGGFVAIGATGAASLLERFTVWGRLIESGGPWYGLGVGGAGAATYSRAASSPPVFVDNYFVSIVVQYGYLVAAAVAALVVWGLVRLSRGSAEHEHYAVYLAVLAGGVCGALMIELWEYGSAMACLALFVAYTMRADHRPCPAP